MAFNALKGQPLADKVRAWLVNSGQGAPTGELQNFVLDLEKGQNARDWAGVNFERILPFHVRGSRTARRRAVWRNTAIFLPIVITWVSLERAVASFTSNVEVSQNFLQHWQELGFPFGLPFVAYADAAIIAYIIWTTYRIGNLEEDDSGLRVLQLEHAALMVALERELSQYRYLSIREVNDVATGTLTALLSSSQEIEKASASFAASAKDAHDAIDGASKTVTTVFDPAVQRLDAVIASLGSAAGTHQQMVVLVQQVQTDFATEINTIRSGIAASINALDQRVNVILNAIDTKMGGATDSMSTGITSVVRAVDDGMRQSVAAIDAAAQQAITSMTTAVNGVASSVSQQTTQELRSIAQQLNGVATVFETLVNNLGPTTNNVMVNTATLADDLDRIHQRLRDIGNSP
jgi:hypothetical protein